MENDYKINFIPGLDLNRAFFHKIVKPLLKKEYPGLSFSAGLMGYGSDVLGFDTPISIDHNWGPRCQIILDDCDKKACKSVSDYLSKKLPLSFKGFPTNFTDKKYDSTQRMQFKNIPPVNHLIEVETLSSYLKKYIKIKSYENISIENWLLFQDQNLLEITSGEVFYDGTGKLIRIREELSFFPVDILKIRLASLWRCIENEEPFIGRCIEVNDNIGVKFISSRIINYLLKICFYLEKKYIPYSKWFGTFLKQLNNAEILSRLTEKILYENDPKAIENSLCDFYLEVIGLHNKIPYLPKLHNNIQSFFGRPYKVIFAESIVINLIKSIEMDKLKKTNIDKIGLDIKIDAIDFSEY